MRLNLRALMSSTLVAVGFVLASFSANAAAVKVDTQKSQITWEGAKKFIRTKHNGSLKLKEGQIDLEKGKGKFVIDMNSIENFDLSDEYKPKLVGHLKSADFFDVENYPTAAFDVDKIESKGNNEYILHGKLTVRGRTKPISVPATIEKNGKEVKLTAKEFKINRIEYGISYGREPEEGSNDHKVLVEYEKASKKKDSAIKAAQKKLAESIIANDVKIGFEVYAR